MILRTSLVACITAILLSLIAPHSIAACTGCCSSHGGITNSCAFNGNVVCVDRTISPSCSCNQCGVAPPPPTCNGGQYWNGLACVCPTGQGWNGTACVLPALQCGVERWGIKTGTDPGARSINQGNTVTTNVASLSSIVPPNPMHCVIEGTRKVLDQFAQREHLLIKP